MISKDFTVMNKKGIKLAATIDLPDNEDIKHYALFLHCFTCTKELKSIANVNSILADAEYATVRIRYDGNRLKRRGIQKHKLYNPA